MLPDVAAVLEGVRDVSSLFDVALVIATAVVEVIDSVTVSIPINEADVSSIFDAAPV